MAGVAVRVVPEKDWEVLSKYLNGGKGATGVVLISETIAKTITDLNVPEDGTLIDYDFGGDPDLYVDVVLSTDHNFLSSQQDWEDSSCYCFGTYQSTTNP